MATTGTTTGTGITTPRGVLDAVHRLAPAIAARAGETEAARRIPPDLLEDLRATGVFRMLRPPSHGGMGADLLEAMEVFEALSRADASVGWTCMIGAGSWRDLAGLPRAGFDELFADAPDTITAGVFAPTGAIAPEGDAYRVTGRWSFASGCEHADWLYGNCIEGIDGGVPRMRIAVFTPDQATIEDTWNVSGLCGTGSHHVRVDAVRVSAARTTVPLADPPCVDIPFVRVPPPGLFAMAVAAVALGIARGALDDLVAIAPDKTPLLDHRPLAANPTFQHALARADTELAAARALVRETAAAAWETAADGGEPTSDAIARIRAAGVWSVERAADVVRTAHREAGGGAIHLSSPTQRRLRDVTALGQHFLVRRDTLTAAGALLLGQLIDVPVF